MQSDGDSDLHDHYCLLHDIAYAGSNKLQQYVDASLSRLVNFDCCLANRLDAPPHEVDVHSLGVSRCA